MCEYIKLRITLACLKRELAEIEEIVKLLIPSVTSRQYEYAENSALGVVIEIITRRIHISATIAYIHRESSNRSLS